MSREKALAGIQMEVARMARSCSPVPDRTFVMGMIEMAEFCGLLSRLEANKYRDDLDAKFSARHAHLKRVAA